MGSVISRTGSTSGSASYSRPGSSQQLPRPPMRRSISSVLICGASSSAAEMEDYPAELLVNSAEHGPRKKLRNSDLSVGIGGDLISMKNNDVVPSTRLEDGSSHDDPSDTGKWLSESRELVPSRQCFDSSRCNGIASSSTGGQPSPYLVSENGMSSTGDMNDMDNMKEDTSRIGLGFNNSTGVSFNALGESFLDEISIENYVSEEVDYSSSNFGSSFVSDSPLDLHILREDVPQEVTPSDENLLNVDVISISNPLPANSAEINSREIRRNSRRLFWDAFSRRTSRRHAASRTFVFSAFGSDRVRSPDRQVLDFSGGLIDDEFGGNLGSHGIRTPGSNDQQLNPRFELWDNFGDAFDTTYYPPPACPRGVHADGTCLCQSSSLAEESGPRTGISRIVMLAEALFEVLDQIHQQPMSLSLSVVSLPAPESVVDSFPVKTHRKSAKLEFADDVSQCYICLAEYEEGDKIRVLPCHHEYHMTCVDKWLKEIHGVCPLCRGDVSLGSREV